MKIFLAVLAALLCAFFIGRSVIGQDRARESWSSAKNHCTAEIQASFGRSTEIGKYPGVTSDELSTAMLRIDRETKFRTEMMTLLKDCLEHKPDALTPSEQAELTDVTKALQSKVNLTEAAGASTPQPTPATPPSVPAPPSQAFLLDVGYSQRAAAKKYPQLAVKGSPLNLFFLSRMNEWKAHHDPRMDRSDWPERLADDCAKKP